MDMYQGCTSDSHRFITYILDHPQCAYFIFVYSTAISTSSSGVHDKVNQSGSQTS